jgi:hypothetical protein
MSVAKTALGLVRESIYLGKVRDRKGDFTCCIATRLCLLILSVSLPSPFPTSKNTTAA